MNHLLYKRIRQLSFVTLSFIALSGFSKITQWGKENFKQAESYAHTFVERAKPFIRSTKVLHEFSIFATFDVMLLADGMRMLYVDYHKKCHGLSKAQEASLRQRQLNEDKYFISMYVVATQASRIYLNNKSLFTGQYQVQSSILGHKDATWNVSMIVDGRQYFPESIRTVDLPIEYVQLFGPLNHQFATVYLVRFAANDENNNPILPINHTASIILQFSSSLYQTEVVWKQIPYYAA